jgi:hypothetical protein
MVLQEADVDMAALTSSSPEQFVNYTDAQAAMNMGTRGIDINQATVLSMVYEVQYRVWRHLNKHQATQVLERLKVMEAADRGGSGRRWLSVMKRYDMLLYPVLLYCHDALLTQSLLAER